MSALNELGEDWANVSRPLVYYSLEKLVRLGLLRPGTGAEPAAGPGVFEAHLRRRQAFLCGEIAREEETLRSVEAEVGRRFHEAVWMLALMIDHLELEARWIDRVLREAGRRAPAKHPPRD